MRREEILGGYQASKRSDREKNLGEMSRQGSRSDKRKFTILPESKERVSLDWNSV